MNRAGRWYKCGVVRSPWVGGVQGVGGRAARIARGDSTGVGSALHWSGDSIGIGHFDMAKKELAACNSVPRRLQHMVNYYFAATGTPTHLPSRRPVVSHRPPASIPLQGRRKHHPSCICRLGSPPSSTTLGDCQRATAGHRHFFGCTQPQVGWRAFYIYMFLFTIFLTYFSRRHGG